MNKNYRSATAALLIVAIGFWWLNRKSDPQLVVQASEPLKETVARAPSAVAAVNRTPTAPLKAPSSPGLTSLLADMASAISPQAHLADLVGRLKTQDQKPVLYRDSNPYTGDMFIVRTESPFPRTRYFHAQYFNDEQGQPVPQHISFDFQKGEGSMAEVVSAVGQAFPDLGQPAIARDSYMLWHVGEDRILWVKKLDASDLQDEPFNAYSRDDVGTIRVAMELDIEGGEK